MLDPVDRCYVRGDVTPLIPVPRLGHSGEWLRASLKKGLVVKYVGGALNLSKPAHGGESRLLLFVETASEQHLTLKHMTAKQ